MSEIESTYKRILSYLKGLLSNRERHDLEKEIMRDAFDDEAFEGLTALSAEELETDMEGLMNRLDDKLANRKKRIPVVFYRIAATFVLLVGIGSILYFVVRTPSQKQITQEIRHEKPPSQTGKTVQAEPALPVESKSEKKAEENLRESQVIHQEEPVVAENEDEMFSPVVVDEVMEEEILQMAEEAMTPPATRQKAAQATQTAPRSNASDQSSLRYITGRIVGVDGEALPGVNVLEKGTSNGTVTDVEGSFSLQVGDTGSKLALNYIGYKPLELNAKDITGVPITMQEDLLALEEVVVIGYGTKRKNEVTGAVSRVEAKDITPGGNVEPYNFIKPTPPEGSLKTFKNWVNERVDTALFTAFPGKHKLLVTLTVLTNGSVRDIRIKDNVPVPVAEEYRKIIEQSPLWRPALKDNVPVEAEVVIRFYITVE